MKRFFPLRRKLTLFFVGIILWMAALSIVLFVHNLDTNAALRTLGDRQALLSRYYHVLVQLDDTVKNYLYQKDEFSYTAYREKISELQSTAARLTESLNSREALDNYYMVQSLGEAAAQAVMPSESSGEATLTRVERVSDLKLLLLEQYSILSESFNADAEATRIALVKDNSGFLACMGILIALCILACLAFSLSFSVTLIRPLVRLTHCAEQISQGKLEGLAIETRRNDEVTVLNGVFNNMVETLKRQFADIQDKAEIERQLQAEKLLSAQVRMRLVQSELRVLQSRINPHFMFNTLNTIVQLSYLESAPRSGNAAELLGGYLRYALETMDAPSTLVRELEQLDGYIRIQKLRFAERIRFEVMYDGLSRNAVLPSMTLQPFVENAISHGVKDYLSGGLVSCRVETDADEILVRIEDNGVGMSDACIEKLRALAQPDAPLESGDSIGIWNVCQRMNLLFGRNFSIDFESAPGIMTRVSLRFPLRTGT